MKHPKDKPYTTEAAFTKAVHKYLKTFSESDLFYEKLSERYKSGVPDVWGCYKGKFFVIELKDATGVASPAQEAFIYRIKQSGGAAIVARTIAEVEDLMEFLKNKS
jgi:hypothetical protein